jgi:formiminotetrahydrofolate cyclodeaminase
MIKEQSIEVFLEQLAAKTSTPGGGSAAAIMGAMGAALASMVVNFTIGRKGSEAVDAQMRALLAESERMRGDLTDMIRADVEAFDAVMAAYGMPKDSEEQKERRSAAIQAALKTATDVPLSCAQRCAELIRLVRPVAEHGNRNVISDAGVAVLAAEAALRSAALNVYVNLGSLKDPEFVAGRRHQLEQALHGTDTATEEIYRLVRTRL